VGSEHPITVIVPVDGDAFSSPDGAKHTSRGFFHRRNRKRIWKIVPGWHLQECIDVLNATPGKHFK
jgi:hypothetical protein